MRCSVGRKPARQAVVVEKSNRRSFRTQESQLLDVVIVQGKDGQSGCKAREETLKLLR